MRYTSFKSKSHLWQLFLRSWLLAAVWALSACAPNHFAPAAEYTLLDGTKTQTSDLAGKVYLVNFWATTCTSCVAEMPELVETYERFHTQGFDTVAVAMDYDPPQYVARFAASRNLPFKVALDHTGENAQAWGEVRLTPTTFLVDRQGRVVKRFVGPPEFDALHRLIEQLLNEPKPV